MTIATQRRRFRALLAECETCVCPPPLACYCERNAAWAQRQLDQLNASTKMRNVGDV